MSKTFKCPYCDYHGSRQDLVEHIDDEHDEMIPEGFSPVHLVFDIVNGKRDHHGICVVCKRDTEWDENASKYKRLCGRKQCAEALRDIYKKNMLKVHGKITLLDDPEQQEKMLANRGISGKVQFDDKGFHTYTGSYERKLLEFENSIGFKASDILSPGPTIEYDYKGEKHKYITDQMIIPFNLIIEVKDGGGNTNNRINNDSRDRTIAKEIAITKLGKYNYLRLTNNSFDQLLETLAELKAQMVDDSEDNKKVIININEEVEALEEATTDLNAVFNGNDIYIRVDEFKVKKLPILFITGMSGGGKTTLAKKIVEQQKCAYIEIDAFSNCQYVNKKDHPWLFEYLRSIGNDSTEDISNYCEKLKNMSQPDFEIERAKYIKWVVDKASNSNQAVIEGVQVPNLYKDYRSTLFTKYAMILKGTSLLISFLRRIKRDKTEFLHDLPHFIGRYIDWYESQNHLRKDILQEGDSKDDVMRLIKESESQDVIKTLCGSSAIVRKEYSSFSELCKNVNTPEELLAWMRYHNVDWYEENSKGPMHWPDDIVKNKSAICFDQAVFEYYWCKKHGIESCIVNFHVGAIVRNGIVTRKCNNGHIMTIFKTDNGWSAFIYHSPKLMPDNMPELYKPMPKAKLIDSLLKGYDKCASKNIIDMAKNKGYSATIDKKPSALIWGDKQIKVLDKFYGNTNIGRDEIVMDHMPKGSNQHENSTDADIFDYMIAKSHNLFTTYESCANEGDEPISESNQNISKQDWEDIKTIYSSLNAQEKKFIGGVTNSPKVVFCKVYKEGSKPVAFVRGFDFGRDEIIIEVCVASYARGKGYAVRGVNECVAFTKMKKYDKAVYLVNKKNTASIALAKKCGFKLEMTRKDYFIYVIQTSKSTSESSQNIDEFGGPGGMVGAVDLSYVTQYGYKGSESDEVEGYALSNDILTKNILIVDNKTMKVKKESSSFLNGRKISIYKYTGENSMLPILNSIGKRAYREYFYEALTGKTLLSDDQILIDGQFSLFSPPALHEEMVSYVQTIVDECHYLMGKPVYKFPIANETELEEVDELLKGDKNIAVFENLNGYFAENMYSKKRTGYYKRIKDIQIGAIKC